MIKLTKNKSINLYNQTILFNSKLNQLKIEKEVRVITERDLVDEDPKIMNPEIENPFHYLYFRTNGKIYSKNDNEKRDYTLILFEPNDFQEER